jgi:hypothetical protein
MYPAIKLMMIRNLTKLQSMTNRKKIQNLVLEDKPGGYKTSSDGEHKEDRKSEEEVNKARRKEARRKIRGRE